MNKKKILIIANAFLVSILILLAMQSLMKEKTIRQSPTLAIKKKDVFKSRQVNCLFNKTFSGKDSGLIINETEISCKTAQENSCKERSAFSNCLMSFLLDKQRAGRPRKIVNYVEEEKKFLNDYYNKKITEFNLLIRATGYWFEHISENPGYMNLYKDNTIILKNLHDLQNVQVNSKKTRLVFRAWKDRSGFIFDNGKIKKYEWRELVAGPLLYKNKIITVGELPHVKQKFPDHVVKQDGRIIFKFMTSYPVADPVQQLFLKDGHWIMETQDEVFIDGVSLNKRLGYKKIFNYSFYNGKLIYFFDEGTGKVRLSYNRNKLKPAYDAVYHYGCCDKYVLDPGVSEKGIRFYALRGAKHLFVEIK